MQTIDTSKLEYAPIFVTNKGAKQLPILYANGENVVWQPTDFMEIPFEPSAYNDPEANRVTLCVNPSEAVCDTIIALDEWCITTLCSNPVPLLGLQLTPEQIRERFVSCLKTSEKGYKTLRMKMSKSGRYALQCYNADKEKCEQPDTWRGCSIQPRICLKGLYLMGRDMGPIFECTHVLLRESAGDECPFV